MTVGWGWDFSGKLTRRRQDRKQEERLDNCMQHNIALTNRWGLYCMMFCVACTCIQVLGSLYMISILNSFGCYDYLVCVILSTEDFHSPSKRDRSTRPKGVCVCGVTQVVCVCVASRMQCVCAGTCVARYVCACVCGVAQVVYMCMCVCRYTCGNVCM